MNTFPWCKTEPDSGLVGGGRLALERGFHEFQSGALLPFAPFSLPQDIRVGEGERRQRCEGHLPLPPSRTLTKGGHGRARFMGDREG